VTEKRIKEAGYYHARAAEMMAKAQEAPSKATRAAYLNLARKWARRAATLEEEAQICPPGASEGGAPRLTDDLGKN
jgi:hypothetical protein